MGPLLVLMRWHEQLLRRPQCRPDVMLHHRRMGSCLGVGPRSRSLDVATRRYDGYLAGDSRLRVDERDGLSRDAASDESGDRARGLMKGWRSG